MPECSGCGFVLHAKCLIGCRAPGDIIGLDRQHFCKVNAARSLSKPTLPFHRTSGRRTALAAQWLLRNQRVWPNAAGMDLVLHHVNQFHHVDDPTVIFPGIADRYGPSKSFSLPSSDTRFLQLNLISASLRRKQESPHDIPGMRRVTQVCFQNLAQIQREATLIGFNTISTGVPSSK